MGDDVRSFHQSLDELRAVCLDDADDVVAYFGATPSGNFVDPHTGFRGNILHVVHRTDERPPAVERALPRLLAARSTRYWRPAVLQFTCW